MLWDHVDGFINVMSFPRSALRPFRWWDCTLNNTLFDWLIDWLIDITEQQSIFNDNPMLHLGFWSVWKTNVSYRHDVYCDREWKALVCFTHCSNYHLCVKTTRSPLPVRLLETPYALPRCNLHFLTVHISYIHIFPARMWDHLLSISYVYPASFILTLNILSQPSVTVNWMHYMYFFIVCSCLYCALLLWISNSISLSLHYAAQ